MRKIRKNSTTYLLLLALEKSIETGASISDFLNNPGKFAWTGYRTNLNYSNLYKAINQLRTRGYVETKKDGSKILLKLTDSGKQQALLQKLLENKNWDGKWRIVIFDIPEKHRKIRSTLRGQLRQWQFSPIQKSVWISKKDVVKELKIFINSIGISDWVQIFEADIK